MSINAEHGNYGFGYDDLYRLTTADKPSLPGMQDEAYSYDPVGNRKTSALAPGDWDYTANNELTAYSDVSLVYDNNGNMVERTKAGVVRNQAYDVDNRMTRVADGYNVHEKLIFSRLFKNNDGKAQKNFKPDAYFVIREGVKFLKQRGQHEFFNSLTGRILPGPPTPCS